jgi:uncharacterized protein YodC (DUF2158 family)
MNTLKVGDVVQLKSGGPQMTVCKIDEEGITINCCWFNGKKVEKADFPLETLETEGKTQNSVLFDGCGY